MAANSAQHKTWISYRRAFPALYRLASLPMLEFVDFTEGQKWCRYSPMNPTFDDPKLPMLGNTSRMSVLLTPNHRASVAAY